MTSIRLCGAALLLATAIVSAAPRSYFVYAGTYTRGQSKGIYVWRFDASSGKLDSIGLAGEVSNPSWVTIHPNHKYLYAVSEMGNNGRSKASVTSFQIDPATGLLKKLNTVSSGGGGACHLAVDKTGKSLSVANYGSGSVAIMPIHDDGTLGEVAVLDQHKGSGPNPKRQEGPHAHGTYISADNRFLFVPDLGLDEVFSYKLDPQKPAITPNDPPFAKVPPGAGPRHFAFHPNNKYAYTVNEMGSSVTAFSYDAARGALTPLETVSTLPKDFSGIDNSAEIQIDVKGKFLYASNRGNDTIAVFAIGKDGKLSHLENVPTQGKTPRGFNLDPTGAFLIAGNQDSGNIVVFRVDQKTGRLTPTGTTAEVSFPVCIQFLPAK